MSPPSDKSKLPSETTEERAVAGANVPLISVLSRGAVVPMPTLPSMFRFPNRGMNVHEVAVGLNWIVCQPIISWAPPFIWNLTITEPPTSSLMLMVVVLSMLPAAKLLFRAVVHVPPLSMLYWTLLYLVTLSAELLTAERTNSSVM